VFSATIVGLTYQYAATSDRQSIPRFAHFRR
jgi:hypothetical protein